VRFLGWMKEAGVVHQEDVERIESEIAAEIADAVDFAENSEWEPVAELTRHVYAEAADEGGPAR
jgi:TPP-dependent pyruvate/acetoin dehydrogenase alpha subunit